MKSNLSTILLLALCLFTANAHEHITVGPGKGRIAYLDSTTTPSAEFNVKEGNARITLLDKDLNPIPLKEQTLVVTAGERGSAAKLAVTKEATEFVAPLPKGEDYWCIFQLKEKPDAKSITFRVHYNAAICAECKKPEWICLCGNKGSGKEVEVPADLKALWAEINGHHGELTEALKERDFQALDEVTDAFPILLTALPGNSTEQAAAAKTLMAGVTQAVAGIRAAGAARTPEVAKTNVADLDQAVAELKKLYPSDIANAKLKE